MRAAPIQDWSHELPVEAAPPEREPESQARLRLHGLKRATVFPFVGALLALGAPLGLLALRALITASLPTVSWVWGEFSDDLATYLYTHVSTTAAFTITGHILGRQQDRLFSLSFRDALTGLHNARYLHRRLDEGLARHARYGATLSVLLLDLDGLKQINDTGGHAAGDLAILALAGAMSRQSRSTDIPVRTGGDEFAILCPETGREDAANLAERIRHDLRRETVHGRWLSVSIGVAEAMGNTSGAGLLKCADAALYRAKASGRNQVCVAGRPTGPTPENAPRGKARAGIPPMETTE